MIVVCSLVAQGPRSRRSRSSITNRWTWTGIVPGLVLARRSNGRNGSRSNPWRRGDLRVIEPFSSVRKQNLEHPEGGDEEPEDGGCDNGEASLTGEDDRQRSEDERADCGHVGAKAR